ncbi:MAG: UvrD-helicase domain-containing protein [Pseudomonadota bacterium]
MPELRADDRALEVAEPAHLVGLNPEQRAAVTAPDGPLLVLAGAGTGKTRVLTTRIGHLLLEGRVRPGEVLAVTFTNKAAREMGSRVEALIRRPVQGLWLGTFHAIGARILRQHAERVGLEANFTILDADDQQRLLKQVVRDHDLDDKKWPARVLMGIVQRWKDRGWTPDKVPASEHGDFALGRSVELYRAYQARLVTLNACDFGDLLLHGLTLFERELDVLEGYQRRFKAVLVDEYQDTNVAQYLWLRLLAQGHRNLTCVGDDDQSIYSWRGAEVGNILRFERDFPGATVVRLERNYRSTGHILGCAAGLIAKNEQRHGKTLWTEDELGQPVRVAGLWDDEEEARFVGEELEALQRAGGRLADAAVLVRAGFQTRSFEERFIAIGLPYRVVGGPRFYERAEVRDGIAYLRVLVQPDDDLAFERIVNVPKRGLGESTMAELRAHARAAGRSLVAATAELLTTDELKPRPRRALASLLTDFARWRRLMEERTGREVAEIVLEESGYVGRWQTDKSPDAPGRLENLKELVQAVGEFDTLAGFLEHVSLVMDNASDPDADMVSIMTLHGAKGLEFGDVFLGGWEEGVFPNQRALDEHGRAALEEERRLAYVGITRARRRCTVLFAANRRMYQGWVSSVPSRFVEELPASHCEFLHRDGFASTRLRSPGVPKKREGDPLARFNRARQRVAPVIDAVAEPLVAEGRYGVGERVFHQKFGYGRVEGVEGNKLDIAFEKAGRKKVIESFVEPVR